MINDQQSIINNQFVMIKYRQPYIIVVADMRFKK